MDSGVVTRRGGRRGVRSACFTVEALRQALASRAQHTMFLETDGEVLRASDGSCPAAVAVQCALASSPPAAALVLEADCGGEALRLRMSADAPPLSDLTLWFDETTLALLDMPFLTLRNITGTKAYVCHECGVEFDEPNPLKVHLFLKCQRYEMDSFWRRCVSLLRGGATPALAYGAWAWSGVSEAKTGTRRGHECVYCGKLYSRRYGLKIHIRTHTGYKPLRCRHCARPFGDPSNLNKHLRLHAADARPSAATHACALCGKALARRRDLQRHLRAHHACNL